MKISGRIYNYRSLKHISFLILKEEGVLHQIVVKEQKQRDHLKSKSLNDYLLVLVSEVPNEISKDKSTEYLLEKIIKSYNSLAEVPYPFYDSSQVSKEIRLKNRAYELSSIESFEIFSFKSRLLKYIRCFFDSNDHLEIITPKIISTGAEGGSELFPIRYFDKKAYLSQSPQLFKQMAINQGFKRIYQIGAIYRGEKSNTNRHLAEATSVDFEMELPLENPLNFLIEYNIKFLKNILEKVSEDPLERVANRAKILLEELNNIRRTSLEESLENPTKEGFVVIDNFEKKEKPFYIKANGISSLGIDIEYNGLELTSGGVREENYTILSKELLLRGHNLDGFKQYLRTFKGGAPLHGGNAYGLQRLMIVLLNKENVREATMYYRDRKPVLF